MKLRPRICGLMGIEHGGEPGCKEDGICFTTLVSLDAPDLPVIQNPVYKWMQVKDQTLIHNICFLFEKGKIVPFIDLSVRKT